MDKLFWLLAKLFGFITLALTALYFLFRVVLTFTMGMHSDLAIPATVGVFIIGILGIAWFTKWAAQNIYNHFKSL